MTHRITRLTMGTNKSKCNTTGCKWKMSNVDEEPAQAKKKMKTGTKTSEQGKGKASKRTGKESKPKRGKKTCVFTVPLLWLLTTSFLGEKRPLCEPRRTPLQNGHLILQGESFFCVLLYLCTNYSIFRTEALLESSGISIAPPK